MLSFFRSLKHGIDGFRIASSERNMRLHLVAVIFVSVLGFVFEISSNEWCIAILCFGSVISAECLNTSIERLADRVTKERDDEIKIVKDAAASGVLISSLASICIGSIIFVPKILAWLS